MATDAKQNVIKAKSENNQRAAVRSRYGNDVVEILEEDTNDDWQDVQAFAQHHVAFDD